MESGKLRKMAVKGRNDFVLQPNFARLVLALPDIMPNAFLSPSMSGKQLLLAKIRHNRLVDNFFGLTAYSLRDHPEFDPSNMAAFASGEIYFAVGATGSRFVINVQTKHENGEFNGEQALLELSLCRDKFPHLLPRSALVQFMVDEKGEAIVFFEFRAIRGEFVLLDEKHYRLIASNQIGIEDSRFMAPLQ